MNSSLRTKIYGAISNLGLLLGPLLYFQGKHVRRSNRKLPEASGERVGKTFNQATDQAPAIKILVLGDSSAAGVGARDQARSLVGEISQGLMLDTNQVIYWEVVAKSGVTCSQLIEQLLPDIRGRNFDYVLVAIGVNNVLVWSSAKTWLNNLDQLESDLNTRLGGAHVIYNGLPPMHKFSALPFPLREVLGFRCKYLDHALRQWCQNSAQRNYLPITIEDNPELLAEDGFHPSEKGYRLWAKTVVEHILQAQRQA